MVGLPGGLERGGDAGEIRLVRAISRLVGGSSIQAITLTKALEERGYRSTLVTGEATPEEGTMDDLAQELGVNPVVLPGLRRSMGPHDARAIAAMRAVLRRERPAVLHTHAAKGGTVGRVAAMLAGSARPPVVVHTFHGHVLRGYFPPRQAALYTRIERALARRTTRIVAVAPEVKDDLVELGVAPAEKIEVIPLGFELEPFARHRGDDEDHRRAARERIGFPLDDPVVTLIARLVPVKRVDRFLAVAASVAAREARARFAIVGDGELERQLRESEAARVLGERLIWAGYRRDMPTVCAASDIVVLTSDNEGTPVSLIEAQASARPVVSTEVGGVRQVVEDGVTGYVRRRDDEAGLVEAVASLIRSPARAAEMGARGRERVLARYTLERLTNDVDRLYRELLGRATS